MAIQLPEELQLPEYLSAKAKKQGAKVTDKLRATIAETTQADQRNRQIIKAMQDGDYKAIDADEIASLPTSQDLQRRLVIGLLRYLDAEAEYCASIEPELRAELDKREAALEKHKAEQAEKYRELGTPEAHIPGTVHNNPATVKLRGARNDAFAALNNKCRVPGQGNLRYAYKQLLKHLAPPQLAF